MTKTEKLQYVDQRIRKLVPRLQELSFGCKFQFTERFEHQGKKMPRQFLPSPKHNDPAIFTWLSDNIRSNTMMQTSDFRMTRFICMPAHGGEALAISVGAEINRTYFKKNLKIIGHPIDLEAVLEALGQFSTPNNNAKGKNYAYSCIKGFLEFQHVGGINSFNRRDYIRLAVYWQYGKPLSEQSDELTDFLFNIFSPTK